MTEKKAQKENLNPKGLFSNHNYTIQKDAKYTSPINYKIILFTFDLLLSFSAFILGAVLTDNIFFNVKGILSFFHLFVFAMISISFFVSFGLYSHHRIISKRTHIKNIAVAIIWSAITIFLIVFLYEWPQIFSNQTMVPLFLIFAIVLLLLSRVIHGQLINILQVLGVSFLATGSFGLVDPVNVPEIVMTWETLVVSIVLFSLFIIIVRYLLVHFIFAVIMRRQLRRDVLIIGHNRDTQKIANFIIRHNAPYWILGMLGDKNEYHLNIKTKKPILGKIEELPNILQNHHIDEIIVTDENINKSLLISIIDFCTSLGIPVWLPPKIMTIIDIKLYIDQFCGLNMIQLKSSRNDWVYNKLKHAFDAVVGLLMFIVLIPILSIIAIAIKVDSKGPIFYRPQVVGKGEKRFHMFKFRSMMIESNPGIHKEYVTKLIKGEIGESGRDDQTLKITDDPRVTAIGKFLRKFSLDELPQIINIVKGEMSFVGPRPCLPYEFDLYKDWHKKRTKVRPGITGLWQVSGRSNVSFEDMILLDLYYIYNRNILMDLNTLFETLFVVLQRKGAY